MTTQTTTALDALLATESAADTTRLNVDLDTATYEALRAYAKSHKKTLSKVVRAMIKLHLPTERTDAETFL